MTIRPLVFAVLLSACGPAELARVTVDQTIVSSTPQPGCPPTWAEARALCDAPSVCTVGARCSYPGVGDQLPDGRWADGALICFDPSGTNATTGEWRCAQ